MNLDRMIDDLRTFRWRLCTGHPSREAVRRELDEQRRDERASPQVCALVLFGGSVLCWGLVILLIRLIFGT